MKRHSISQPEHIRGVLFFSPCASQGALHDNRLPQWRDDSLGILLKHQIFGWREKRLGLMILSKIKKKSGKVLLFWSPVLKGAPYLVPLTNRGADLSGTVLIVGQRLLVRRWQLLLHHQCQTQPLEISTFLQSNVKAHICRGQTCLTGSKRILLLK